MTRCFNVQGPALRPTLLKLKMQWEAGTRESWKLAGQLTWSLNGQTKVLSSNNVEVKDWYLRFSLYSLYTHTQTLMPT